MNTSPVLFPKTLLDIKISPETVFDLYSNCGLPPDLVDKLFSGIPPQALSELVEVTQKSLEGAHEAKAKLSDLNTVIHYTLFWLLTKGCAE